MNTIMKTAVMTKPGIIEMQQRPVPVPADDEALVRLEYVGICGSDIHYFEKGRIGDFIVEYPFVLGHECAGTVEAVGKNVTNLKPGDRVALEPGKTCGKCRACREGKYNLCPDVVFFATPPVDGVFCEYVAHEADLCFKLPQGVNPMEGALIEPLAVGFHAAEQGDARLGKVAAVFGSGCIGMMSLLAMKAMGVTQVCMIDGMDSRLEKARSIGADRTVNFTRENVVQALEQFSNGAGCDLIIDTSGSDAAAAQAVQAACKGGTLVMVGYSPTETMAFPLSVAINKELKIETVFRYRHIYPRALAAVAAGNAPVDRIVTHTFGFDEIQYAMTTAMNNKAEVVKAVIKM